VRPGHGVCAGERLVACVVVWLVGAWRRRQAPIRLAESPRIPSSKSVWNSRSCTISRSPSKIGETERCYLFFRQLNYPQAEGTRPITQEQLQGAPSYAGDNWDWEDRERGRKVYEYYGMPYIEY
jgi:hypothetical protein